MIFGVGSAANSAFGLLLVPLYSRVLVPKQFGELSLLTVTLTLLAIVLKFGLNHAFFRHYCETQDDARRRLVVGSTLVFLLATSILLIAALYPLGPQLSWLIFAGEGDKGYLVRLVLLICFFETVNVVPDSILRANLQSARYSTLNIISLTFQVAAITFMLVVLHRGVEGVLIGRLAGTAFEAVVFFVAARRHLSMRFSAAETRSMLAFGFPLIFSQLSFTLFMMIDRFFLDATGKRGEVGQYALANNIVSVISVLVTVPFSQVWTVMRFSVMNEEGAEEYYSRVLTYIVLAGTFLALLVSAVGGDGVLLFARRGYWPAATVVPLLALATVLDGASRVLNVGITLRKRTIYAPLVIIGALVVNVGLNFWLIPRYGIMGATVSTLVSYVVFCALRFWASNLFFKVNYEWKRVFTILATGGCLLAGFYLIDQVRGLEPARTSLCLSAAAKILLAGCLPLLLYASGFFDEKERRRLAEIREKVFSAFFRAAGAPVVSPDDRSIEDG